MRSFVGYVLAAWGANARSALEYRFAFVLQAALMLLNNLIFLAFWAVFFARFESVAGWGLSDVALLFAIGASGFGLTVVFMGGVMDFAPRVAEGRLDTWLLRPRSVFLQVGLSRSWTSGVGDLACGVLLLVVSGNAGRAASFAAMSLVAATVLVAFATAVNALAFFLGHASSVAQQSVHAVVTLALYPAGLFGGRTRILLYTVLPAGLMTHAPTSLVRDWSWSSAGWLALGVTALVGVSAATWCVGLARYESGNLTQVADQ